MSIVDNRKAFHDFFIEEKYEAGLVLEGWEVKAIRAGRAHLKEAYVIVRGAELFLLGAHITPLTAASTHVHPDPTRTRKLLMNAAEIDKLARGLATFACERSEAWVATIHRAQRRPAPAATRPRGEAVSQRSKRDPCKLL